MESRAWMAILVAIVLRMDAAQSANILGLFPTDTQSHYIVYGKLMRELAKRGHQTTTVSLFPQDEKIENLNDIPLNGTFIPETMTIDEMLKLGHLGNQMDITNMCVNTCENVLKHYAIQDAIREKKIDLFITEIFGTECFSAVGHKLGVPSVGIITSVALPWVSDMISNPDNPSYIPLYFTDYTQRMSFLQRTYNFVLAVAMKVLFEVTSNWPSQEIVNRVFGPMPPLKDLSRNYSLILLNSHFSINQVRPMVPQLIEVGGLHISNTLNKIPEDVETFLNKSAEKGIIYFSLGSIVSLETMNKDRLHDTIEVLGNLKQNVLWKIDSTLLPKLPSNIKTFQWIPQHEVLCHPSTKLFISHGGLLGTQEAIHCGVPIIGIPMFADQGLNLAGIQEKGAGLVLQYEKWNKKTFSMAIDTIVNNKSFTDNVKKISKIFKDRPLSPMDTAVYWIEYVLRHGGAPHLKSPSLEMHWYQYFLLDVIVFLILVISLVIFVMYRSIKFLCKVCESKKIGVIPEKQQLSKKQD